MATKHNNCFRILAKMGSISYFVSVQNYIFLHRLSADSSQPSAFLHTGPSTTLNTFRPNQL